MYFLARALMENAGLREVHIVDPRAGEIVSRLRSPASKLGSHFRHLLNPISHGWTGIREYWRGDRFGDAVQI